jgi:hypothetical protein
MRAHDPEQTRGNLLLGWALFGVFAVLFGLTVLAAFVYLLLD